MFEALHELMRVYRETLEFDRRVLLEQFELTDFARKVVGVGSVGTRAWIALLLGRDGQDPLFLQMKEAEASVLEEFLGPSEFSNHGERVVVGQRLMQATSDIFLGWLHVDAGLDGKPRDFYGRQLKDWKGSAEIEQMVPKGMATYGRLCGWTLARAHARSGDRDRDRRLPRQRRQLRPRDPRVLRRLRRAERTRLQGTRRRREIRPDRGPGRPLSAGDRFLQDGGGARSYAAGMDIQFIASLAVITPDPGKSRELLIEALGLPLQASPGSDYFHSEQIEGSKHFAIWPLADAAQACFGTPEWPADRTVPQMSVEFEVRDADAVRVRRRRTTPARIYPAARPARRSRGARRSLGCNRRKARSSGSRSRPCCTTDHITIG